MRLMGGQWNLGHPGNFNAPLLLAYISGFFLNIKLNSKVIFIKIDFHIPIKILFYELQISLFNIKNVLRKGPKTISSHFLILTTLLDLPPTHTKLKPIFSTEMKIIWI